MGTYSHINPNVSTGSSQCNDARIRQSHHLFANKNLFYLNYGQLKNNNLTRQLAWLVKYQVSRHISNQTHS